MPHIRNTEEIASAVRLLVEALPDWADRNSPPASHRCRWIRRQVPLAERPWPARVLAYNWRGKDHRETDQELKLLFEQGERLSQEIGAHAGLNSGGQIEFLDRISSWGGTRGKLTLDHLPSVLEASLLSAGVDIFGGRQAPWSSGWTKVAAICTRHFDEAGSPHTPQVIWDSRVANALRLLIDARADKLGSTLRRSLQLSLRQIKGRGGTRREMHLSDGWQWAWTRGQQWEAQRVGSHLVAAMRDELNRNPERYGYMPSANGKTTRWTSWGVGLALFVEGY